VGPCEAFAPMRSRKDTNSTNANLPAPARAQNKRVSRACTGGGFERKLRPGCLMRTIAIRVLLLGLWPLAACSGVILEQGVENPDVESGVGPIGTGGGGEGTGAGTGGGSGAQIGGGSGAQTGGGGGAQTGGGGGTGADGLTGYWVWDDRVADTRSLGFAHLNGRARMRMAFGAGNTCHYIWNETTGSDFHTECTYKISGDMVTYTRTGTVPGYSCTHPDWTSWNDRPAVQYGKYKFVGDKLYLGVNAYWGFGGAVTIGSTTIGANGSCKRFGFWESLGQADYGSPSGTLPTWIVYKRVTKAQWDAFGNGCVACATYPVPTVCR